MKILTLIFRREAAVPAVALTFASGVSVFLVLARVAWTWKLHYAFLAWLPLIFALLACERYRGTERETSPRRRRPPQSATGFLLTFPGSPPGCESRPSLASRLSKFPSRCRNTLLTHDWRFSVFAAAWLLLFPNAPYIFTDIIHLTSRYYTHFWVDLVIVLSCALTGLVLGFVSLYLMQCIVVKAFGRIAGWLFIALVAGLSSFGIYLGRFLRFNSWDVLFKPVALYHGIGSWITDPLQSYRTSVFPLLFATFLFISYVMLYALTHLQPASPTAPLPHDRPT